MRYQCIQFFKMASVACAYKQTLCEQRIRILCLSKTIWFFRSSVQEKKNQTLILNYCILTLCLSIFCLCIEVNYQTIIWKVNSRWNTYILGFFTCYWRNYCLFVYLIYNRAYFRLCSLTFTPSFWISYILKGKMRVCNLFPLIKYMMY